MGCRWSSCGASPALPSRAPEERRILLLHVSHASGPLKQAMLLWLAQPQAPPPPLPTPPTTQHRLQTSLYDDSTEKKDANYPPKKKKKSHSPLDAESMGVKAVQLEENQQNRTRACRNNSRGPRWAPSSFQWWWFTSFLIHSLSQCKSFWEKKKSTDHLNGSASWAPCSFSTPASLLFSPNEWAEHCNSLCVSEVSIRRAPSATRAN